MWESERERDRERERERGSERGGTCVLNRQRIYEKTRKKGFKEKWDKSVMYIYI